MCAHNAEAAHPIGRDIVGERVTARTHHSSARDQVPRNNDIEQSAKNASKYCKTTRASDDLTRGAREPRRSYKE